MTAKPVPSVSVSYAANGSSTKSNALGMRPMQERAYERRGEQYLLIKSPPASGKSRALMFIALDKLQHQGLKQAIIVVPEKASLLMEQVLAPRFEFKPKHPTSEATPGFDYGEGGYDPDKCEGGYDPDKCNVGVDKETGKIQIEIKGLAEPRSAEAERICREELNEVIAPLIQDKTALERGLFDEELVPEEITQVRMGKIIKDKYPELTDEDHEAVRQHAIAALNITQHSKQFALEDPPGGGDGGSEIREPGPNTALIKGVRRFAMDVRELDIDLIDRINPFGEAYSILAKTMSEESLKQVAAVISGKRVNLTIEEARELAKRALKFKQDRGRLPSITSQDAWEKRMAEGVAVLTRMKAEAARA